MPHAPLHSRGITTLAGARRALLERRSPYLICAIATVELVLRIVLGGAPAWRDAAAAAALAAIYPFGEWAIHVHLLHLRPFRLRGRRVELPTARAHRQHHEAPDDLNMVLLDPGEVALLLVLVVPLVVLAGAGIAAAIFGGGLAAGPMLTAMLAGTVLVGVYEWTHFLIHTAYRPRHAFYRRVWRGHRLHHFKNERYWHGITSTVADRVFRTAPDQRDVPRSRTARTLQR